MGATLCGPDGAGQIRAPSLAELALVKDGRNAGHSTPAAAEPICVSPAALPARPAGMEAATDKSLVSPTAKAVAPLVAQLSQRKTK